MPYWLSYRLGEGASFEVLMRTNGLRTDEPGRMSSFCASGSLSVEAARPYRPHTAAIVTGEGCRRAVGGATRDGNAGLERRGCRE